MFNILYILHSATFMLSGPYWLLNANYTMIFPDSTCLKLILKFHDAPKNDHRPLTMLCHMRAGFLSAFRQSVPLTCSHLFQCMRKIKLHKLQTYRCWYRQHIISMSETDRSADADTHNQQLHSHGQGQISGRLQHLFWLKQTSCSADTGGARFPAVSNLNTLRALHFSLSVCVYEKDEMVLCYFSSWMLQSIQLQLEALLLLTSWWKQNSWICLSVCLRCREPADAW